MLGRFSRHNASLVMPTRCKRRKEMSKTFIVEMVCQVRKSVTVECDDEDTARENPWDFATDEVEIDQMDWKVVNIEEA
jgi:hypothetical protein